MDAKCSIWNKDGFGNQEMVTKGMKKMVAKGIKKMVAKGSV